MAIVTSTAAQGARQSQPPWISALLHSRTVRIATLVLLTLPFWSSGLIKLTDFSGAIAEQRHFGVPAPVFAAGLTIFVQLVGSAMVVFRWFAWLGAGMLGVFTMLATLLAHAFWSAPEEMVIRQFAIFTEHMALIAGLILFAILDGGEKEV